MIDGNAVLPTVCAISWMIEAAESICDGYTYQGLENYKLFKGVVCDGQQAAEYFIDVTPEPSSGESAQMTTAIRIAAKVSSLNANGKVVFHYAADLIMATDQRPQKTYSGDLPVIKINGGLNPSARQLYQDGTLFHGESLQGIVDLLHCDEKGLVLACRVPEIARQRRGEFSLHHRDNIFVNDLVYQAMLVWARKQLSLGSLPSSTKAWTIYALPDVGELFYLALNLVAQKASTVVADITLISSDKRIFAEINSAEVTTSESLNDLFKPAAMATTAHVNTGNV